MKNKEEIIDDSVKLETPPSGYSLIEIQCFLALKQLLHMFYNRQISTENAAKTKRKILAKYEMDGREFEFEKSMFGEHIKNIMKTSDARIKLRKMLNSGEPVCEVGKVCMQIIKTVFRGEFENWS